VKAFFKGSFSFWSGGKARVPSNICQPLLVTTVASGKSTVVVVVMAAGERTSLLLLPVPRAETEKSNWFLQMLVSVAEFGHTGK
jgi:hypothetical protein